MAISGEKPNTEKSSLVRNEQKLILANSRIVAKGSFFILTKMNNEGEAHAH
jgi:hypothetical protein